ncbi:MAG: nucleotide exchange factor GrpE [Treponema sp.]|nr:nucleotide exchange factor GrpE [Treponema sp.]
MALLDFFQKKEKHGTRSSDPEIIERLTEIGERLYRIEAKQKETSIQLEGIDDLLQDDGGKAAFIDAMIMLADTIGDFYYFAAADGFSPLSEQARMMWNAAINAAGTAGLEIIDSGNEPFDFRLHSVNSTECNDSLPNGHVIKTLKCGFKYKEEIIRRAAVVVNKIDLPEY